MQQLRGSCVFCIVGLLPFLLSTAFARGPSLVVTNASPKKHAYATMLYMGTPRDHEFYIAARVMLQSLRRLQVDADLVVIASRDVPQPWIKTLERERVKVVIVDDIPNPYRMQEDFDPRFLSTLNKLYAWRLVEYERVVMLDADNIFLRKTDELFQCGQFCAVFINPCIFHTGLFVLEPSMDTFNNLIADLKVKENKDGADQGFIMACFDDLLEKPLFMPPSNGSKLNGYYRLPLGYQMDASYYYLKLRWNVPCGPNSVITFPSLPWLKPWYWWSWPVLPLGLQWHGQRKMTIGYATESPVLVFEALFYIGTMITALFIRKRMWQQQSDKCKLWIGRGSSTESSYICLALMRPLIIAGIGGAFLLPAVLIPRTVHPLMGWPLELLGSFSLLFAIASIVSLPMLPVLTPWLGMSMALVVMAVPVYCNGIIRVLAIGSYSFMVSPFCWWALKEIMGYVGWRFSPRNEMSPTSELSKIC